MKQTETHCKTQPNLPPPATTTHTHDRNHRYPLPNPPIPNPQTQNQITNSNPLWNQTQIQTKIPSFHETHEIQPQPRNPRRSWVRWRRCRWSLDRRWSLGWQWSLDRWWDGGLGLSALGERWDGGLGEMGRRRGTAIWAVTMKIQNRSAKQKVDEGEKQKWEGKRKKKRSRREREREKKKKKERENIF